MKIKEQKLIKNKALSLYETGKGEACMKAFELYCQVLKEHPNDVECYVHMDDIMDVLYLHGWDTKIIDKLAPEYPLVEKYGPYYSKRAIKINPDYAMGWLKYGKCLFDYREDMGAALKCFKRVVEIVPKNKEGWYYKGQCEVSLKKGKDVERSFETLLKLTKGKDPFGDVNFHLAECYEQKGEYKQAIEFYEKEIANRKYAPKKYLRDRINALKKKVAS